LQLRTLSSRDRRYPAAGRKPRLQRCSCTDGRRVASARQMRASRCERVSETTAGLRQPLLVARRRLVVYARLRFATVFCFPRGAYAPRSCCSANACRRKTIFAMHERTFTRAAGVSPPWVLGKRTCRNASAKSRGTAGGVLTNAGGVALANHGGLTPPALTLQSERLSAEKRFLRCTNAGSQERPASARRGC
jgi:hypothetical protein